MGFFGGLKTVVDGTGDSSERPDSAQKRIKSMLSVDDEYASILADVYDKRPTGPVIPVRGIFPNALVGR